jgi:hypothetical protein
MVIDQDERRAWKSFAELTAFRRADSGLFIAQPCARKEPAEYAPTVEA